MFYISSQGRLTRKSKIIFCIYHNCKVSFNGKYYTSLRCYAQVSPAPMRDPGITAEWARTVAPAPMRTSPSVP